VTPPGARWVVVDLEATCWTPEADPALAAAQLSECETIEIGAVRVDPVAWTVGAGFRQVIRPRRHPRLSAFCTHLTGITQADVDAAPPFPEALAAFLDWAGGDEGLVLAAWGGFDDRQLRRDVARWGLAEPRWTRLNIKRGFAVRARALGAPRGGWMGFDDALAFLGGAYQGRRHSALDDARNAAWVLCEVRADPRS
jgi:inhibitor of KinA sporulation pathway (predicted exonuclease)